MIAKPPWRLEVATYNVLADAYIKPEYYPRCDPEDFAAKHRHLRLDARMTLLGADVICVQEVEHEAFLRFRHRLERLGYRGRWAHRPGGKPDGLATFVRSPWSVRASLVYEFAERAVKRVNRIALVTMLAQPGALVTVVNTHLEWHPDDAPANERHGLFQAEELLEFLQDESPCVICGDLNASPESDVLEAFRSAGYADAHSPATATFNGASGARKIDHLLHTEDLAALPRPPTRIVTDETPLPSAGEPSDHVPLVARFSPRTP